MKKTILFLALFMGISSVAHAQIRVRDIFAAAPDSVFPLLTQNNRLDCLDFMENNMPAKVKNRLNKYSEMTSLTSDYLRIQMSEHSTIQMRVLNDEGLFCLIRTYLGPTTDSHMEFFDAQWCPIQGGLELPNIKEFWQDVPDSLAQTAQYVQMSQTDLPLMQMEVNQEGEPTLTISLQSSELADEDQTIACQYTHPIVYRWKENHWEKASHQ